MIQDHIRSAQLYYAGTIFSNQATILNRLDELERENAALIIHSANLAAQAAQLRSTVTALRGSKGVNDGNVSGQFIEGGIQTPRSVGRVVKVAKGDTLRIISLRYYGDPEKWRDIFEANREKLKHAEALQIGQSIVVPDHRR
jgi:nucleoid-associated protein YgaU